MLSSRWTLFTKYILGPFWIVTFGAAALLATLAPNRMFDGPRGAPPPGFQWIFVGVWIIVSTGLLRFTIPLKRVELRDGRLYVSNYFREWEILSRDIESVRQNPWVNARPIRVRLRHDVDGLGSGFIFIPPTRRMLRFWREDPQVDALRRFAERAIEAAYR
jgi:hypothetical protein